MNKDLKDILLKYIKQYSDNYDRLTDINYRVLLHARILLNDYRDIYLSGLIDGIDIYNGLNNERIKSSAN